MDLRDTPEEAAFRSGLRTWLEEHLPDGLQGHRGGATRFDGPEMREWSRALYDAGYVGLTWPEEYGGGGAPYTHQAIFLEEMARAEAPPHIGVIGHRHGRADDHRARHRGAEGALPRAAPLGGGDLVPGLLRAGRRVRPRRRADELDASTTAHFVVNGQKVWSSFAHIADFCILLTRSDPDSSRHAGLTYLIVDMHAPGRRGAAAAADHGRGRVQRDLLLRRARSRREPPRRGRRRLAGRDDDAPARARHARLRAAGGARGADPQARRARPRPRRRPAPARPRSRASGSRCRRCATRTTARSRRS